LPLYFKLVHSCHYAVLSEGSPDDAIADADVKEKERADERLSSGYLWDGILSKDHRHSLNNEEVNY
jgi:hypothetical protein